MQCSQVRPALSDHGRVLGLIESTPWQGVATQLPRERQIKMKNLQRLTLAFVALCALSAVLAASASAETTLGAEWLANGNAITTNLSAEAAGQFLLEDTGSPGEAAVLCSRIIIIIIGPNGILIIEIILNLAGATISSTPLTGLALTGTGAGSDCVTEKTCAEGTSASPIEVWPVGLPWEGQLFTMEDGKLLALIKKAGGGTFGYELLCLVAGLNVVETCTSEDSELEVLNDSEGGDAATPASSTMTPNALCTLSGKETGVSETDELTEFKLVSGELLTVDAL
jgi:hypothetical protein